MIRPGEHHVRFTPELWAKWWARQEPTAHSIKLREGIQEFRALLARQELRMKRR